MPYSLSRYLDACATRWDALVWGDYEFGVAIPWFRRWGIIPMGYTPPFLPRLDWLGSERVPLEWQQPMREYLCGLFGRSDWVLAGFSQAQGLISKPNYILQLNSPYHNLSLKYSEGHRRILKKAALSGLCVYRDGINQKEFLDFHQKWNGKKSGAEAVRRLPALIDFVLGENKGELRVVRDTKGTLLAAALFLRFGSRIINLVPVTAEAGRGPGAMHFLLDGLIREASDSTLILDFEGSVIPGVARFYAGFGAGTEFFYRLSCNP